MNDHDIRRLLQDLPRHRASEAFTPRVLQRSLARGSSGFSLRKLAAAASLLMLLAAGGLWSRVADTRQEEARMRSLRAEREQIRREIEELKRLTRPYQPVIEIPGGEIDFVIELNEESGARLARQPLPPV
jgi:DNA-binding transcriptional MerR regulator